MKKINYLLIPAVLVFVFTIVSYAFCDMGKMDMGKKNDSGMAMCVIDGMTMKKGAMVSYKYKGETLYFCNKKDVEQFKKSPDKYLKQTAICPVSKVRVSKKKAPSYKYNGKTYYFCCKMDLDAFKKNPKKYVK